MNRRRKTSVLEVLTYTVEGTGPFPHDMLRYDCSWPATEKDAAHLDGLAHPDVWPRAVVRITLKTHYTVTPARWASFGWKVVD